MFTSCNLVKHSLTEKHGFTHTYIVSNCCVYHHNELTSKAISTGLLIV